MYQPLIFIATLIIIGILFIILSNRENKNIRLKNLYFALSITSFIIVAILLLFLHSLYTFWKKVF